MSPETADAGSGEPTFDVVSCDGNRDEPTSFANRTDSRTDTKPVSLDFSLWDTVEHSKAQNDDPELSLLKVLMGKLQKSSDRQSWDCIAAEGTATKAYWAQWQSLILHDGVLYRKYVDTAGHVKYYQLIPPRSMRQDLIRLAHTGITGGHLGPRKTLDQVQRRFYWCGWRTDVHRYCRQCTACASITEVICLVTVHCSTWGQVLPWRDGIWIYLDHTSDRREAIVSS